MAKTSQPKKQLLSYICHILGVVLIIVVEMRPRHPPMTRNIIKEVFLITILFFCDLFLKKTSPYF